MSRPLTIESDIHFQRRGRGARRQLDAGPAPAPLPPPGRVPRVARLMALAIRFAGNLENGQVRSYAELAKLGHVTRPRISQVMNLLNLASDIQEAILFLPPTTSGHHSIHLGQLQNIACKASWASQRTLWTRLRQAAPPAK
jgi:hypothetical protein